MKKTTDITVILDRSGSMDAIKQSTIESYNSFLKHQKSDGLKTSITLAQFDDEFEMVYEGENIESVEYLNSTTYIPRGMTALLDAIGTSIKRTKKRLKLNENEANANNVIIVIITDGMENASIKYSRRHIFQKIRKMEEKSGWKFIFLAANQDAIEEGSRIGINRNRALTFMHNDKGIHYAMHSLSHNISYMKINKTEDLVFSPEDKEKQK